MEEKQCKICGLFKSHDEFQSLCRKNKDGTKTHRYLNSYCLPCSRDRSRKKRAENIELARKNERDRYYKHHESTLERQRQSYHKNKHRYRQTRREYVQNRRKNDPLYAFKKSLRSHTQRAFTAFTKSLTTERLLGCSFEEAKKHIESLWKDGMTWENYGLYGWHIDHIIPLCSAKSMNEAEMLCHFTNLQPLWAEENLSKNGKILDK